MTIPKSGAELWLIEGAEECSGLWVGVLLRHVNGTILGGYWVWLKAERCKAQWAWLLPMMIDKFWRQSRWDVATADADAKAATVESTVEDFERL
jgi:hypothetical protein